MARRIITVFGGTGFLGRAIVRRLAESGFVVRVAARNPPAAEAFGRSAAIEYHHADITDEMATLAALQGAEAAVNAVSLYVESRGRSFEHIHIDGAARVARLAGQAGARALVHVSGIGADPESPSAYVRARARGEHVVRAAFPKATILRPSVLFGPDDAFLNVLETVTRLPVIPLFSDGRMRLQPVHVEDVATATVKALSQDMAAGRVFELGGDGIYSYRQIIEVLLERAGRRRLLVPLPFSLWRLLAAMMSVLPNPPLTRDQVMLMQHDNVVSAEAEGFAELGIRARGLGSMLERDRFV